MTGQRFLYIFESVSPPLFGKGLAQRVCISVCLQQRGGLQLCLRFRFLLTQILEVSQRRQTWVLPVLTVSMCMFPKMLGDISELLKPSYVSFPLDLPFTFLMRLFFNLVLHATVRLNNCHRFVMTNTLGIELSHEVSSWSGQIMTAFSGLDFWRSSKSNVPSPLAARLYLVTGTAVASLLIFKATTQPGRGS